MIGFLVTDILLLSLFLVSLDLFIGFYSFAPQPYNIIEIISTIITGFGLYLIISFFLTIICFIILMFFNRGTLRCRYHALLCFVLPSMVLIGTILNQTFITGSVLLISLVIIFICGMATGRSNYSKWKWIGDFPKISCAAIVPILIASVTLILISSIKKFEANSFSNTFLIIASISWGMLSFIVAIVSFHGGSFGLHMPNKIKLLAITICFIIIPVAGFFVTFEKSNFVGSKKNQLNFLLITFDALRADAVGAYGSSNLTPAMNRMAKEGIFFEQAYSMAPLTLPSMTSFISSKYPMELEISPDGPHYKIPKKVETFAEVLQKHGYITTALVGNHLLGPSSGVLQGFNQRLVLDHHLPVKNRYSQILPMMEKFISYCFPKPNYMYLMNTSDILLRRTIEFLKHYSHTNFFLWVHFMDPHDPYNPPKEFRRGIDKNPWPVFAPRDPDIKTPTLEEIRKGSDYFDTATKKYIRELYDGEVLYADHLLSIILNTLKDEDIFNNTVICITSDHGEEFWEHGDYYHGQSLYQELVRVPLILYIPGYKSGIRFGHPVSLIDVMPTLFDIAKFPVPDGYDGKSLLPSLKEQNKFSSQPIFFEATRYYEPRKAILKKEFKLIYGMKSESTELYNLSTDPQEKKNISASDAKQVELMRKELYSWILKYRKSLQKGKKDQDDIDAQKDQFRRMKALGYL